MSALSALMLSGCMVGPDYVRPSLDVPFEFRSIPGQAEFENSEWLTARWWTEYKDPSLDFLVTNAIKNNRTLQQTMANVEKAAAALTVARSSLFPQLDYSGTLERDRLSENTYSGASLHGVPYNTRSALAAASWEIDLWGKIRRQTESATATLRSTEAAHKAAISSVIGSVVSTYLSILMTDEQLQVARETAKSYKETYDLFVVRAQHGNVSDMEVVQAKSQWESAKVEVPSLEQSRTELVNSLAILTGVDPVDMPKFKRLAALKAPKVAKGIPSRLLIDRPDVVEAEQTLISANADIGAARALYFPSISLSGGFGFSSAELKDLFKSPSKAWSYTGSISGPIFHWGAIEAGVRSAEAEQKAMLASYRQTVAQAFADVDNALSKRRNAVIELKDRSALVESLKEYKRLAYAQYNEGYTAYVTVLQAEQSLLPQQLSLATVRANALNAVAEIYQSLGGGWIDVALAEEQAAIAEAEEAEKLKAQQIAQPAENQATSQASGLKAQESEMAKKAERKPNQIIVSN